MSSYSWWLEPHKLFIGFVTPIYLSIYLFYRNSIYIDESYNYLNGFYFYIGLLYLLSFVFITFIIIKGMNKNKKNNYIIVVKPFYLHLTAILCLFGYLVWYGELILQPNLILNIFLGETGTDGLRNQISTIPGITTLSQLGVVYAICYVNYVIMYQKKLIDKKFSIYLFIIIIITIFRVFIWSERLALIELAIPLTIGLIIYIRDKKPSFLFLNKVVPILPFLGIGLLFLLFGITEYFRSWNYYSSVTSENIVSFTTERILNYYSTALNNGVGAMNNLQWPSGEMRYILNWLYQMPLIGEYLSETVVTSTNSDYKTYLRTYGDTEFNNPSGLFMIMFNLGIIKGYIYTIFYAIISGVLYKSFVKQNGIGVFLYPVLFISYLEILRTLYLSSSSTFPILLFSVFAYFFSYKIKNIPNEEGYR
ncbi:hypothetical protein [Thalassobacillus devorans]|uniref:hypothetical protein n=1 Tax=Thalassobacillus devorans TaxID=279813 RepID=UPI00048EBFA0|nr:hypothetical protein [Thalassobacillus devorans]